MSGGRLEASYVLVASVLPLVLEKLDEKLDRLERLQLDAEEGVLGELVDAAIGGLVARLQLHLDGRRKLVAALRVNWQQQQKKKQLLTKSLDKTSPVQSAGVPAMVLEETLQMGMRRRVIFPFSRTVVHPWLTSSTSLMADFLFQPWHNSSSERGFEQPFLLAKSSTYDATCSSER